MNVSTHFDGFALLIEHLSPMNSRPDSSPHGGSAGGGGDGDVDGGGGGGGNGKGRRRRRREEERARGGDGGFDGGDDRGPQSAQSVPQCRANTTVGAVAGAVRVKAVRVILGERG